MQESNNKLKAIGITTLVSSAFLLSGCLGSSSSGSDNPGSLTDKEAQELQEEVQKKTQVPEVDENFDVNATTEDGSPVPRVAVQAFIAGYANFLEAHNLFEDAMWGSFPEEKIGDDVDEAFDNGSALNKTFDLVCKEGSGKGSINFDGSKGTLTKNWNNCLVEKDEDGDEIDTKLHGRVVLEFAPDGDYFEDEQSGLVTVTRDGDEYILALNLTYREYEGDGDGEPDTVKGSAGVKWGDHEFRFSDADFIEISGTDGQVTGTARVDLGALDRSFNLEIEQSDQDKQVFEYTYKAGDFEQIIIGRIDGGLADTEKFDLNGRAGACIENEVKYSDIKEGSFCK